MGVLCYSGRINRVEAQVEVFKGPQSSAFGPNALAWLGDWWSIHADPGELLDGEPLNTRIQRDRTLDPETLLDVAIPVEG